MRLAVLVLVLIGELRLAKLLHHGAEETVGDGKVKDDIALRALGLLYFCQRDANFSYSSGLVKSPCT